MKRLPVFPLALCCTLLLHAPALSAEKMLPAPQKDGGPSVLAAIEHRSSAPGDAFPMGAISDEELATLLWAATGRNREGKGWTVPTGMGKAPYCSVYVIGANGIFLYDKEKHALHQIGATDIRAEAAKQDFGKKAPYTLVFVADDRAVARYNKEWGPTLVGAMTQNLYLAAQALGIGARYAANLNEAPLRKALKLEPEERLVCIVPLGHF